VGAARNANLVVLMRSVLELQKEGPEQVVIFDRSVLDDYVFMRLRSPLPLARDPLALPVAEALRRFSLILRVNHRNVKLQAGTTRVTLDDRLTVSAMFSEYFDAFDISVQEITTDPDQSFPGTDPAIDKLADQIQSLVCYARPDQAVAS